MQVSAKARFICCGAIAMIALAGGGCSSQVTTIVPTPPANAKNLGPVEGSANGALGVLSTDLYFIPIGLNSRTERAYAEALAQKPGATALTNVTIREDWYWFVLGTMRRVTIKGEAVK